MEDYEDRVRVLIQAGNPSLLGWKFSVILQFIPNIMKNVGAILLYLVIQSIYCPAQTGWTNYNTENSPLLGNLISSLAIDHDNNLWAAYAGAGGAGNGIVKFDGTDWVHYNSANSGLPNDDIRDIAVDVQGNIWFACYNAGIVKFNGTTWTRFYASNSNIAGNDAVDIEFDSDGNLWLGCYFSGVSRFNGTTWTTWTKNNAPFPGGNCISDLTVDKNNTVWVGLDCGGGMARFTPGSGTWTGFTTSNSNIPDHTVRTLQADTSGIIWASHINVNFSRYDGSAWTAFDEPDSLYSVTVGAQGKLWGYGLGLFEYHTDHWSRVAMPEEADTSFVLSVVGTDSQVWVANYAGLWVSEAENIVTALEPSALGGIQFFPNPVSTTLSYTGNPGTGTVLVITDILGRSIKRVAVSADNPKADVSDLPPGIYQVKLITDKTSSRWQKIIKH